MKVKAAQMLSCCQQEGSDGQRLVEALRKQVL
jgi:hypothetical protein